MKHLWRALTIQQRWFVIGLGLIFGFLLSASVSYSIHSLILSRQRTVVIEQQMALIDTLKQQHINNVRYWEKRDALKVLEIQKRDQRLDSITAKFNQLKRKKHDVPQIITDMDSTQLLEQFRGILSGTR
jgi:predicted secreted acid phosphatase